MPAISKTMSSDLGMERWAVISERGREATGLTHEDARRLAHRLAGEGRHGLCIVSNEAAQRLSGPAIPADMPAEPSRERQRCRVAQVGNLRYIINTTLPKLSFDSILS